MGKYVGLKLQRHREHGFIYFSVFSVPLWLIKNR